MTIPYFYNGDLQPGQPTVELDDASSRHVLQVLRMKAGEQLNLTDGKGNLYTCEITEIRKKHCTVSVISNIKTPKPAKSVSIAISLLKTSSRFEWFLEKATEIGVSEIIPLLCERTIKEKFRHDRMNAICISAMLQSQQGWLPLLHQPTEFTKVVTGMTGQQRFIAHCETEGAKNKLLTFQPFNPSTLILIGPEGDFTSREIERALENGFIPVSLGETRLRTETAGVVAASWLAGA